jgi:hypothetical protein
MPQTFDDVTITTAGSDTEATFDVAGLITKLHESRAILIHCPFDLDSKISSTNATMIDYGILCDNKNNIIQEFNSFNNSDVRLFAQKLAYRYRKDECTVVISAVGQK